jgi:hypothetical protein
MNSVREVVFSRTSAIISRAQLRKKDRLVGRS